MSLVTDIQQLVDESGGATFWTAQHVYDSANQAQFDMWAATPAWNFLTTPFTLSSGNDIVVFSTSTIMIPQYLLDTSSAKIYITNHDMLQDYSSGWRNEPPARPKYCVLWDAEHLRVFPRADAAYTYTLCGVPWPTEITAANPDMLGDPLIIRSVALRAAAKLLEFTQPQLADAYELQAMEMERRFQSQLRRQQGANTLRLAPSRTWQHNGDIAVTRRYR